MAAGAATVHADRRRRYQDEYPPRIDKLIELGSTQSAETCAEANNLRLLLRLRFDPWLGQHSVFMTPATMDFAPAPETTGRAGFNSPWSFLEYPTVSVPAGLSTDGLPFAVQFIAGNENESHLLASAAWAERCFEIEKRLPPVPS